MPSGSLKTAIVAPPAHMVNKILTILTNGANFDPNFPGTDDAVITPLRLDFAAKLRLRSHGALCGTLISTR